MLLFKVLALLAFVQFAYSKPAGNSSVQLSEPANAPTQQSLASLKQSTARAGRCAPDSNQTSDCVKANVELKSNPSQTSVVDESQRLSPPRKQPKRVAASLADESESKSPEKPASKKRVADVDQKLIQSLSVADFMESAAELMADYTQELGNLLSALLGGEYERGPKASDLESRVFSLLQRRTNGGGAKDSRAVEANQVKAAELSDEHQQERLLSPDVLESLLEKLGINLGELTKYASSFQTRALKVAN